MAAEWKETLETEREISAFMLELGIPAHLRGYYYLREAVLLAVSDMELVGSVTKLLYPVIARRYKTTLQRVERAIRNAVESKYSRSVSCSSFSIASVVPNPLVSTQVCRSSSLHNERKEAAKSACCSTSPPDNVIPPPECS